MLTVFAPAQAQALWSDCLRVDADRGRAVRDVHLPALATGTYALLWSTEFDWLLAQRTCTGTLPDLEWTPLTPADEATLGFDASPPLDSRSPT